VAGEPLAEAQLIKALPRPAACGSAEEHQRQRRARRAEALCACHVRIARQRARQVQWRRQRAAAQQEGRRARLQHRDLQPWLNRHQVVAAESLQQGAVGGAAA
jgi:hypothetical protein